MITLFSTLPTPRHSRDPHHYCNPSNFSNSSNWSHTRYLSLLLLLLATLAGCTDKNPPKSSLEVAINGINGGALSFDGQYAVVGSVLHGGSFWRLSDGERLYNWNHAEQDDDRIIISADIDPSNTRALTADAATIVLWDLQSGQASRFWTSPAEVLDSKLADGGRFALLGLADHSAVIFDAVRGGIARTFPHKGRVRSVDISDDQLVAITGSEDHTAVIWQVSNGKPLLTINHEEDVQLVRLSPNRRYALSAAKYDRAEIWDIEKEKAIAQVPLKAEKLKRGLRVTAATFNNNGSQLLLGYPNRTVELRMTTSMKLLKRWTLPKRNRWQPTAAAVVDLAFDRQRGRYRAISSDGFVHLLER